MWWAQRPKALILDRWPSLRVHQVADDVFEQLSTSTPLSWRPELEMDRLGGQRRLPGFAVVELDDEEDDRVLVHEWDGARGSERTQPERSDRFCRDRPPLDIAFVT